MSITIQLAYKDDFSSLITIWASSVRVTHDFLPENIIQKLKPLILNDYFSLVQIYKAVDENGNIRGFIGLSENKIEMLFIAPECLGKGIGKKLLTFAINEKGANEVDVNEQNKQGVGFYLQQGFQVYSRSDFDGQGNPFPLLHLKLI